MARRHFGSVRRRSSGRWQATYWHDGRSHYASQTFAAKSDALAYLAIVEADIHRGAWIDPRAGQARAGTCRGRPSQTRVPKIVKVPAASCSTLVSG
jgi:hypothetical protein